MARNAKECHLRRSLRLRLARAIVLKVSVHESVKQRNTTSAPFVLTSVLRHSWLSLRSAITPEGHRVSRKGQVQCFEIRLSACQEQSSVDLLVAEVTGSTVIGVCFKWS